MLFLTDQVYFFIDTEALFLHVPYPTAHYSMQYNFDNEYYLGIKSFWTYTKKVLKYLRANHNIPLVSKITYCKNLSVMSMYMYMCLKYK